MKETEVSKGRIVVYESISPTILSESSRYRLLPNNTPNIAGTIDLERSSAGSAPTISISLPIADYASIGGTVLLDVAETESVTNAIGNRAYPHLLEAAQPALLLMRHALKDAMLALDSYDDGDIAGVGSRLAAISVQCGMAHPITQFNESFGAVVSFIRRATISADVEEISRSALNILAQTLNQLTNNPIIELAAAGDLINALSNDGWRGEHPAVELLLNSILGESASESQITAEV